MLCGAELCGGGGGGAGSEGGQGCAWCAARYLWLGQPPAREVTRAVWRVVCTAAVAVTWPSRIWYLHHMRADQQAAAAAQRPRFRRLTVPEVWRMVLHPGAAAGADDDDEEVLDPVLTARRCAVKEFWGASWW